MRAGFRCLWKPVPPTRPTDNGRSKCSTNFRRWLASVGRPRRKPLILQGDAAYGSAANIDAVRQRGIQPLLAPYGKTGHTHGSGLGKTRYVVERTLSWFGNFRRIKHCYEKTGQHLQAFHELAACLICVRKLRGQRK